TESEWASAYKNLPRLAIDEGRGASSFPLSEALAFSAQSVRLRIWRMFIVLVGVALAVAFMTALLVMGRMFARLPELFETAEAGGDFARWWLVVAGLISVTGITNSMLMAVTERIKEIGTLKCLGATWRHILEIFLFESVFIGLLGGAVGGVMGLAFAALNFGMQFGLEAVTLMGPGTIALGLGVAVALSVTLCLLSSIYPVYYASRIQAAEALRYEV
ncbi:unnamed protein product, partial [marine sediment metagenome]